MAAAGASKDRRGAITRAAIGIGIYAAAFGATFGAVSIRAGLDIVQTMVLSTVMFTGASQFAFVGVLAAGGTALTGVPSALLLGVRNAFYGVAVSEIVRPRRAARLWTAHFVIDESTGMAVAQPDAQSGRLAFWMTALILFVLWNAGTLAGAIAGSHVDTSRLGLDTAAPAIYLALLWPQMRSARGRIVAVAGVVIAVVLIPLTTPGVPVVAAAIAALAGGIVPAMRRRAR